MKLIRSFLCSVLISLIVGLMSDAAQGQVTLIFTNNFSQTPTFGIEGAYFDDKNLGEIIFQPRNSGLSGGSPESEQKPGIGPASFIPIRPIFGPAVFTRTDEAINFEFGLGSPDPRIAVDTFSVRWTGKIVPPFSENYTFYGLTDDGMRVWVDGQLIIDTWVDQGPTEHASTPIFLNGGWLYDIKVEYYENTGAATAKLFWSSTRLPKQLVSFQGAPDGSGALFGQPLAALGGGRFAVSAPKADLISSTVFFQRHFNDAGLVSLHDVTGASFASATAPVNNQRRDFGTSLSAFPDGRLLVGAGDSGTNASGTFAYVGAVYLHDTNGALLGRWPNPDGDNQNSFFGFAVAAMPGNRFAASSLQGFGKVFLFDAATVGGPSLVLTNPTPAASERFGYALASLGTDRFLIGDFEDFDAAAAARGSVTIYDFTGARLRTVRNPAGLNSDGFGFSIAALDDRRFLVGAPTADATYVSNAQFITNINAGAVYLFDDTGTLLQTFRPPDPSRSRGFGTSVAMLGPRVLIGAPYDKIGTIESGRVHLFNLQGLHLETIENPVPAVGDLFGNAVVALDERRFVVGAPFDDTLRTDAGSVYGFDAPLPTIELGSEIPRPQGLDVSGTFQSQGPTVTPTDAAFWHVPSQKLFAVKPGGVLVTWPLLNNAKYNFEGSLVWPTNSNRLQIHVAGQAAVSLSAGGAFSEAVLHATTTGADANAVKNDRLFVAPNPGFSLLMLSAGNPISNAIRFQLVQSIAYNDPNHLHDNAPATVGQPIVDPAGYQDSACPGPQVVVPGGVFAPAPVYDVATRSGPIIPVNRDKPETESDDLVVAFFQVGTKLYDPTTGANVAASICWPHKPVRFRPEWPTNAPKLIIASQQGTGAIDPAQFVDWELYFQNDAAQPGFNPNDEHALRRPFGAGEAVFALRDDLGTPATSEPFVLIRYRDPASGGQWRMKVWQVVAEEAPFFFRYPAQAGLLIQAPFPLSTLALSQPTVGVSGPYWRDRKLFFWAKAAGDDGGSAEIVMRYFYPVQPGFFFPEANPPALGSDVPLLDLRAGTPGTPINVRYDTTWPNNVPELRVGETLVKPKNGLPQIAGQTSVEILYEQSVAQNRGSSVRLIDPVRTRSVPLAQIPPDLTTRVRQGTFYFPTLPPHLANRVSYDPTADRLQLRGEFVEPPAGEYYLLLNVLTAREKTILAGLTTNPEWQAAVNALAAEASSLINVPPDSPGFDSLALTAGDANGTGYVTLAFANSTILSAPAEPISLSIIKVSCPLYRGELKVVESLNPLDEQLTLRHSGDFAGRPEDFEFEWRTLPPVDGLPSPKPPEQWVPFQPVPPDGRGAVDITISGPGLFTLSDNYFLCRYRRVSGASPCGLGFRRLCTIT